MRKSVLALLFVFFHINTAYSGVLVDLDSIVIGVVRPDQVSYQLTLSFRIETTAAGEKELRSNVAKIRNDIIMAVNKYLDKKDSYKDIDFADIKVLVKKLLQKSFSSDAVTDVLIFYAYIR